MLGLIRAGREVRLAARVQALDSTARCGSGRRFSATPEPWSDDPGSGPRIAAPGQGAEDRERAEHQLGREPTDEEIAAVAGLELDEVMELRELSRAMTSLDQPVSEDGETALGDLLASDRPEPMEEVADLERDQRVNEAVERLPAAEASVDPVAVRSRGEESGLSGRRDRSSVITAERARQLEEQGLRRLAATAELEGLSAAASSHRSLTFEAGPGRTARARSRSAAGPVSFSGGPVSVSGGRAISTSHGARAHTRAESEYEYQGVTALARRADRSRSARPRSPRRRRPRRRPCRHRAGGR